MRTTTAAFLLTILAGAAVAGPLNPPAGPVAPTHKTLTEVEPRTPINAANTPGDADSVYRIFQPGSYYLTGNIVGQAGKRGIEIASSNVTLDLNGFTLQGVPGSLDGIAAAHLLYNVTVRDGVVSAWGEDGVDFAEGADLARYFRVENVQSQSNEGHGFSLGSGAIVTNCTAANNSFHGFLAEGRVVIESSYAHSNSGNGFELFDGCVARACIAANNGGIGIVAAISVVVAECVARENGTSGITASAGVKVVNCSSISNVADGIFVGSGSILEGSIARANGGDGVNANFRSNVIGNSSTDNAGAGFTVVTNGARLHDNFSSGNAIGYEVQSSGTLLTRNVAHSNTTNWDVVGGSDCYVVTNPGAAAFSGNSGGSAFNTNPHANFTY